MKQAIKLREKIFRCMRLYFNTYSSGSTDMFEHISDEIENRIKARIDMHINDFLKLNEEDETTTQKAYFLNNKEVLQALLDGKKIVHDKWDNDYIYIDEKGQLVSDKDSFLKNVPHDYQNLYIKHEKLVAPCWVTVFPHSAASPFKTRPSKYAVGIHPTYASAMNIRELGEECKIVPASIVFEL